MKSLLTTFTLLLLAAPYAQSASAASVAARLSSTEAYVGSPITLQISIEDAEDFETPTIPEIDGLDIRSAGVPSQSSRIYIYNGRRSESRSVTLRYLITPRQEGRFEIPALPVEVDGETRFTQPQRFVAVKSVTGDLLFVEIEGGKEKVFVGEPLDLTLKIWLKPYHDAERDLTLSEAAMWQTISEQTSWGGFAEALRSMAEDRQRPGGREVLRRDDEGRERSYYLYEIDATIYPKRPGKIDAQDIQIVVDYPTSLGQSGSPFDRFGDDDLFGGNSPLSRMMNDDFFGSSLGNRLVITSTRPIVGEVEVDSTEVLPVPTQGRPADYRGAVGSYRIVSDATPKSVDAGDPITLNIGIVGTGPMELVQAPPLSELEALTRDFKVADEALAGFVDGDNKLFSTTIRPRREGITEIPAIPFSFFDPETESYQTVMSDPIAITVNEAETLALDAIVGNSNDATGPRAAVPATRDDALPELTNNHAPGVLVSQLPASQKSWWWIAVITPPLVWLVTLLVFQRRALAAWLPHFKSAHRRCLSAIQRAQDREAVAIALTQYIGRRSGKSCPSPNSAVGALRAAGMYDVAAEAEIYLQALQREQASAFTQESLETRQRQAVALSEKLESAFAAHKPSRIRLGKRRTVAASSSGLSPSSLGLLFAAAFCLSASTATASQAVALSDTQRITILNEAGELYSQASELSEQDSADAKELFESAADKYQLLVDSGIHNSELYANLGNAYLQSGAVGRAIANFERARNLDPNNRRAIVNLRFADARLQAQQVVSSSDAAAAQTSPLQQLHAANATLMTLVGRRWMQWTLVIASLIFWGLLIARAASLRFPVGRLGAVPLLILLVSLSSIGLAQSDATSRLNAVIIAPEVSLHAGDGEQFEQVLSLTAAEGQRVERLAQRGTWTLVRTANNHRGWLPSKSIEPY